METRHVLLISFLLLCGLGCAASTELPVEAELPQPTPVPEIPDPPPVFVHQAGPAIAVAAATTPEPPPLSPLGVCLREGGALTVVDTINNNDTRDHGTVLAFDVSEGRRLAVSTIDGTIKFWSLDEFLGEVGLVEVTYGPEIPSMSSTIDFWGEDIVSGDDRGAVLRWFTEGGRESVGGAEPGTRIVAIAVDPEAGVLAQAAANGELVVRPLPGFEGETVMVSGLTVHDLEFADGKLLIATNTGVEVRKADTLSLLASSPNSTSLVRSGGGRMAYAQGSNVWVTDMSLGAIRGVASFGEFVDVTLFDELVAELFMFRRSDGLAAFELTVTDDEETRFSTLVIEDERIHGEGTELAEMVLDPDGELLFVAMHSGQIHLVGCR